MDVDKKKLSEIGSDSWQYHSKAGFCSHLTGDDLLYLQKFMSFKPKAMQKIL